MIIDCARVNSMPHAGKSGQNKAGSSWLLVAAEQALTDGPDCHGQERLRGFGTVDCAPRQAEKRRSPRNGHRAALIFSVFNSNKHYQGEMFNYSQGGMYFEADHEMRLGTGLYVRIVPNLPDFREEARSWAFRTVAVAEVKWCQQLTKARSGRYGIGVAYFPDPA